jgi:hypothetical protein
MRTAPTALLIVTLLIGVGYGKQDKSPEKNGQSPEPEGRYLSTIAFLRASFPPDSIRMT